MATKKKANTCKAGKHTMTKANTYVHPTKGKLCRDCLRDYQREYMVEWRAAKKPAKAKRKPAAAKRKAAAPKRKPAAKKAARPAARKKARKRSR